MLPAVDMPLVHTREALAGRAALELVQIEGMGEPLPAFLAARILPGAQATTPPPVRRLPPRW